VLPSTAADPNVNISDIEKLDNNIQAGIKYLRFIFDEYYKDEPMSEGNKLLFSFATYNAGPGNAIKIRKKTAEMGLDPNVWFYNAEIAAAKIIGRETVQYVSNIYKYYVAYSLIRETEDQKKKLQWKPRQEKIEQSFCRNAVQDKKRYKLTIDENVRFYIPIYSRKTPVITSLKLSKIIMK